MVMHRTDDLEYGEAYWQTLDGGKGYQDSIMWADLAFIVHHVVAMDHRWNVDRAGDYPHVDVGCAMGFMVQHMRSRGFESFGLDYSPYALAHASDQIAPYLRWFDLTDRKDSWFGKERFNLLTSFETLEHLPAESAEQAITHLWNLLMPGGIAVLTVCVEGQPDPFSDPTHVNIAPRRWWEERFEEQGFKMLRGHEASLKQFHLFEGHKGVFVLEKTQ